MGNSDGISIAHALLARLFLLEESPDLAAEHADLCRQEGEKTNSAIGQGTAMLLLAKVALARGRHREARDHLMQAVQHARNSGNELLMREVEAAMQQLAAQETED